MFREGAADGVRGFWKRVGANVFGFGWAWEIPLFDV